MSSIALPDHVAQQEQQKHIQKAIEYNTILQVASTVFSGLATEDFKWSREQLVARKKQWSALPQDSIKGEHGGEPEPTNLEIDPKSVARLSFLYAEEFVRVQRQVHPLPNIPLQQAQPQ